METTTANEPQLLSEGKTKQIWTMPSSPDKVRVKSKNDITAGDGAKHDIIEGKDVLATRTTCNVFRLLQACGIPVAFESQCSGTEFIAEKCYMLPYEIVVRREAHGSYLDRNPHLSQGHIFPQLVLEFFLKTHGKTWKGAGSGRDYGLVKDDPLIEFDDNAGCLRLYYPGHTSEERKTAPKGALVGQNHFLSLPFGEVFSREGERQLLERMGDIARQTFLILERAWQLQGRRLVDFKVEFGINAGGELRMADVIDNDSWRLVDSSGGYMDKQVYRDGGDLNKVTAKYQQVAELTSHFGVPHQGLFLWRGSESDDLGPFWEAVKRFGFLSGLTVIPITCSAHKAPVAAYIKLHKNLASIPDSVFVAFIGLSNSAGPILAANSTVSVIAVPAGYKAFKEDVWSSLRMPSNVPVMTVLEPANAVLAALQILAMRNPAIYAALRFEQEKRMINIC